MPWPLRSRRSDRCARVVATDDSSAALDAARLNAVRLSLGSRIEFVAGSWYEPLSQRTFDVIVSNPPYIAAGDPRVEPAVRRFEPPAALFAGPTGLEALRVVIEGAPRHLVPAAGWRSSTATNRERLCGSCS